MKPLIRPAINGDLDGLCSLAEQKRRHYEAWQPVFHKNAPGATHSHRQFLMDQMHHEASIILVADIAGDVAGFLWGRFVDAPPVYAPGGKILAIDDFVVKDEAQWPLLGPQLLKAIWERGKAQGAVLLNVVCGPKDASKRKLLESLNLSVASEWWVGTPS